MPVPIKQISQPRVLTVDGGGDAEYTTIQAAIDAATGGDTILIYPGAYPEQIVIDLNLRLIGVGNWTQFVPDADQPIVVINPTISTAGSAVTRTGTGVVIALENLMIDATWTGSTGTCIVLDMGDGGSIIYQNVYVTARTDTGAGSGTTLLGADLDGSEHRAIDCSFRVTDSANLISAGTKTALRIGIDTHLRGVDVKSGSNAAGDLEILDSTAGSVWMQAVKVDGTLINTSGRTINVDSGCWFNATSGTAPTIRHTTGAPGADSVTNTMLANMVQATIKGRASGAGTGDPTDLTATQATAILNAFTSGLKGLAPASGGGTSNFLRADGTWVVPSGSGGPPASFIVEAQADDAITSGTYVEIDSMTYTPASGTYLVWFNAMAGMSSKTQDPQVAIYSGGSLVTGSERFLSGDYYVDSVGGVVTTIARVTVNGSQAIQAMALTPGGTFTVMERSLMILEVT